MIIKRDLKKKYIKNIKISKIENFQEFYILKKF